MVALPFSVIDRKGKSVSGLTADEIQVFENGILQRIAAFAEGSKPVLTGLSDITPAAGTSVFILFNTSNQMYKMFPYVCDAIGEFIRRLDATDSVAIYTFSRNLFRAAPLTQDHLLARAGLVNAVAGDDTALFNSVLLTLRDAAKVSGRKTVVVFSNGPDNVSMVAPGDVARVAENEGIPIYIISALYIISAQNPSTDRPTAQGLKLLAEQSGGKLHWAPGWMDQDRAFKSVQADIKSSYTVYYYPSPDSAPGFRHTEVRLVSPARQKWHVRVRAGYETRPGSLDLETPNT
jgi:VWFA-related protein